MKARNAVTAMPAVTLAALVLILCAPRMAGAHCDTLDGPVVTAARAAMEQADVTPVLKWVRPEDEAEIRDAFAMTLEVRRAGGPARDLADRWFFETLVRLHRQGEGVPYSGVKPSGSDPGEGISAADRALEGGSVDDLVRSLGSRVAAGVRERYARAVERRKHAEESVQAGREYVQAYVDFIHYVERLHDDAAGPVVHGGAPGGHGTGSTHEH